MDNPIDIVVISALKEELDALTYKISEITWNERQETRSGYFLCRIGEITIGDNTLRIAAAHASNKMGLTEAAMLTTKAFLACNPKILVLIGICAGRSKENAPSHEQIDIGDIILPPEAIHYYFGKITEAKVDDRQVEPDREIKEEFKPEPKYVRVNDELFSYLIEALKNRKVLAEIPPLYPTLATPNNSLKAHDGPIGSSDLVVAAASRFEKAIEANRKQIAIDMESYAVLRVANQLEKKAVVIKSVSDYGNKTKGQDDSEQYREYVYFTAAAAFYKFIKYLAEKTDFFLT